MLLGIDATNWVHQLYHSQRGMNVLAICAKRLAALVDHVNPSDVVACFDARSFRHDLDKDYKSGRKPKDSALIDYLHAAPQEFAKSAMVVKSEGCEADDCLATLAKIGRHQGERVVIASPDKDLRQCLAAGEVTILRDFATETVQDKGTVVKSPNWYAAINLHVDFGLLPEQWIEFQMLCGDGGDDIKGCPGWGPVTSAAALAKCGSLSVCWQDPWRVPCTQKQRDSLLVFRRNADHVRKLVTLRTDVSEVYDALR